MEQDWSCEIRKPRRINALQGNYVPKCSNFCHTYRGKVLRKPETVFHDSGKLAVLLVYEPGVPGRSPVPIARVGSEAVTHEAAKSAISSANQRAKRLAAVDEFLGSLARAEARQLTETLRLLL
jgi:hypothetical protein